MDIVSTSHNIDLLSVEFDEITKIFNYFFSVDGEVVTFTARMSIIRDIKGIEYSEELDEFIMSIMPLQPKVSKILVGITWDYICGKKVGFPMRLISK